MIGNFLRWAFDPFFRRLYGFYSEAIVIRVARRKDVVVLEVHGSKIGYVFTFTATEILKLAGKLRQAAYDTMEGIELGEGDYESY